MDGKVLSPGAYSVSNRTLLAQPFGKRIPIFGQIQERH
jgi:hypothetical protein